MPPHPPRAAAHPPGARWPTIHGPTPPTPGISLTTPPYIPLLSPIINDIFMGGQSISDDSYDWKAFLTDSQGLMGDQPDQAASAPTDTDGASTSGGAQGDPTQGEGGQPREGGTQH